MTLQPLLISMILIPFLVAILVYLIGRVSARSEHKWGIVLARVLTLVALLAEMTLVFLNVRQAMTVGAVQHVIGLVTLRFDGIGLLLISVVLVLGFFVTLFSIPYMKGERNEEKYYALLLTTIGSIIGLGLAFDLFNLWVWFEAMAISTYFLVAFYNDQKRSLEAGVKYLVQSAAGSALVLFGIAAIFASYGSTNLLEIWKSTSGMPPVTNLGLVLVVIGFGVKAALVPLHTWLPDAHSQAPSGISAMLSGVVIEAGLIAMLRTLSLMRILEVNWGYILIGFACLNILVGNLMALRQTEVKRMLAYSSIAHVGYMIFGFGLGFAFGTGNGAAGGFFHLITHSLMKGLAFLAAGALLYVLHIAKNDHSPLVLDDLNGASRKYPLVAFGLSVAVLALAGIPPFAGFMSKWLILVAGVETQSVWMIIAVVFVALNSVLSLAYYAPIVNRLFKREQSTLVENGAKMPWLMAVPIVVMILVIVVLGVWPSAVNFINANAVNSLLGYYFY